MLGAGCLLWLIPYGIMLSNRSTTIDNVQLLEFTHTPDFARVPIFIGIAVFVILGLGIRWKKIELKEHLTLFTAALALVPIVVHNHQIITGRSLQPVHYDLFTANYLAVLAFILAVRQFFKNTLRFEVFQTRMAVAIIGLAAVAWGMVECHFTTRTYDGINIERDQGFDIARHLKGLGIKGDAQGMVLSYPIWLADDLPTNIPQPVLTAFHQNVFNEISNREARQRYYQYLYYQNTSSKQLEEEIKTGNFSPIIALFGWGRYSNRLSFTFRPLTDREITEEAGYYNEYAANFDPRNSAKMVLSYIIVSNKRQTDLSNVDKWYERREEMKNTDFTLYKVKLKASE